MLLVDTVSGRLIDDDELKEQYATRQPYGEWLDQSLLMLKDLPIPNHHIRRYSSEERDRLYKAFGYTYEEVKDSILQMAQTGAEPTAAMGVDIPLAVLSEKHQPLFSYFSCSHRLPTRRLTPSARKLSRIPPYISAMTATCSAKMQKIAACCAFRTRF